MVTRRDFLAGVSAAALLPGRVLAQDTPPLLRVAASEAQLVPQDYPATRLWTFNGTLPGEALRLPQGARLRRRVVNGLEQPTSVHWHGIRIDNAMDGVPGLTQPPIAPGGSFDYDFALPDAGTYWYHSHAQTVEQVERGLYGPLIVEEADGPDIDAEHVLVLDDIRLDAEAQVAAPFDNFHDLSHAGRLGNVMLTNGQMALSLPARRHQRLRLRLINAANARVFRLSLEGLEGWVVALDGMPLEVPEPVTGPFLLAPAQRADLIVDVTAESGGEAHLVHLETDGGYSQVAFPVTGDGAAARRGAPPPLPPNPLTAIPDLDGVPLRPMVMEGGAMRGLSAATWNGQTQDMRTLAQAGKFWALNGQVDRSETPFADLSLGEPVRMELVNDTAFAHAMHLHGMHFRQRLPDGGLGPWRDTLLSFPGERREIVFVADNPGDWLFHCHMLSHHAAGMGTFLRVMA